MLAKRYNVVQMRQFFSSKSCVRLRSLPIRGEWIEMFRRIDAVGDQDGLSPYGESGLKLRSAFHGRFLRRSLPIRGEWIEILHPAERAKKEVTSLPARGEWIEILLWL